MAKLWTEQCRLRWERETILSEWNLIIEFPTDDNAIAFAAYLNDGTASEFSYTVFIWQRAPCDPCDEGVCGGGGSGNTFRNVSCSNPLLVKITPKAASLPVQRTNNIVRLEHVFDDEESIDVDLNQDWRNGTVAVPFCS